MQHRYVQVLNTAVNSIAFSSIFNIGDTVHFNPTFNGIAVQREGTVWNDDYDLDFEDFSLFQREASWIEEELPVAMHRYHRNGQINVGGVSITGVSESSSVHIGGLQHINAEARIKHIRKLKD
ncbi:spore germination protein GerPE [Ornithinibacillus sp. BX22]|uniref:Spore germination protein GerPE n=2 Tax=Ornithinibacillus TaxID=484508 RepID=A0A923L588_9BACI|nr:MULTISPECIES: spore germination protein GerPE [Ornithinibacillus]MBC5636661.1 spore germination protein GerPE [Ornithinibacillus hominis]MBS3680497.1 spore germination protein GerPE [Ornithinibacillus massiliensis]